MLFADRLKELRKDKGLTQEDMADFLCIKRQTYSAYERKISLPDINILYKLSDFFGVTVDYLLGKSDRTEQKKSDKLTEKIENLSPEGRLKAEEYISMLETLDKLKPNEKPIDFSKKA